MQIFPAIVAFLLVFFTTPLVAWCAKRTGLVDDPKKRKHPARTHTGIIPRAGGASLFIGLSISMILFLPLTKIVFGILLGSLLLMIVGLFDDKKDVNPYIRTTTNAIAAIIAVGSGIGIPFITNPLSGGIIHLDSLSLSFNFLGPHSILIWADLFAFIWIMWVTNIIGWSAGVDGQMPGFVAIAAAVLGILSLRFSAHDVSQSAVTTLSFIVSASFLGFLVWNFYPQKIMPGYGGKTLAGFLLAILAILSYGKLGTALLVLGVPTIDAIFTLIRRIGKKRSPVWADRGHLHHRLLDLGWGKRRIALFYWIASAILGLVALSVNSTQKIFAFLFVAVFFGGFLLWVNFFTQLSNQHGRGNG